MVQEAVSGLDGVLIFPAWGPLRGSTAGLVLNQDPVITLFRSAYKTQVINNAPGSDERVRRRALTQDGQTFSMEPFRGTPAEWVEQLRLVWRGVAFPRSDATSRQFPGYLNRVRRVWAERDNLPAKYQTPPEFFWTVEDELRHLEGRPQR